MKQLQLFLSSATVSLAFLTFQKTCAMDYATSFFSTETSIKESLVSNLAPQILPPMEDGETINTKCQKPVSSKPQSYRKVSIQGEPIRECFKGGQEKVLYKIIPGEDGRKQVLQTDGWPNSVHGMVYMTFRDGSNGWGSGTLIAPNLVLTAAHNLYETDTYKGSPLGRATDIQFFPAKNGKDIPFGIQSVSTFYYPEEYTKDKSEDYGLLVLENPVGENTGYFGIGVLRPEQVKGLSINITGYPGDKVQNKKKEHEMWGMGGLAENVNQNFIEYEIDTFRGQSGSGVWHQEGENYFVVGIHVMGNPIRPFNRATLLTKVRYEQIRMWMVDSIQRFIIDNISGGMFLSVESVDLSHKYIGDFGVAQLCEYTKYLRIVNLTNNNISDDACSLLAQHSTITELILSYNNVTTKGAETLAQKNELLFLDVSWNYIDDSGINTLRERQSQNPNFRIVLDNQYCSWSSSRKVKAALRVGAGLGIAVPILLPTAEAVVTGTGALGATAAGGGITVALTEIGIKTTETVEKPNCMIQ